MIIDVSQSAIDSHATKNFNGLTPAQTERLAILQEELAEAIQAVSKVMRHGYSSCHPRKPSTSNKIHLQEELGHVQNSITMLVNAGDLNRTAINAHEGHKALSIKQYLHHN